MTSRLAAVWFGFSLGLGVGCGVVLTASPQPPAPSASRQGPGLWRANQLQPRRAADHVGHLFPLSWSRQERAHGRPAAGYPRRSAEADPVGPRANRARRSGQERDHRAHLGERAAGDAARIGPQGADGETEGDTSALGGRRRRLRRPLGVSTGRASCRAGRVRSVAREKPDRPLHSTPPGPRRDDTGEPGGSAERFCAASRSI